MDWNFIRFLILYEVMPLILLYTESKKNNWILRINLTHLTHINVIGDPGDRSVSAVKSNKINFEFILNRNSQTRWRKSWKAVV